MAGKDGTENTQVGSPVKAVADLLDSLNQSQDGNDDDIANLDLKGDKGEEDTNDNDLGENQDLNEEGDGEDENEEGANGTGEEVEIDSSTLAQLLGIDESDIIIGDDGSPRFKAKVGQDKEISFDSLLRNYRLQQHVDNGATQVKQEREKLNAERESIRENYLSALQQAARFITSQEEDLMKEYNTIDWATKQKENPTQFIIERENFKDRLQQMQAKRLQLGEQWEKEQNERLALNQKTMEERVSVEAEALLNKIPEWKDVKIAKAESEQLKSYALEQGFSDAEIKNLIDHRAWHILRKARLYDQSIGKVQDTVKKVVKLPKVTKARAPGDADVGKKVKLTKLKTEAQTGNKKAQIEFVNELLSGSKRG